MGKIRVEDKYDYLFVSEMIAVQDMLDLLQSDGVYGLYETKMYKRLNKELLYGVYLVVLTNIKLHKDFKETGKTTTNDINNHAGMKTFTCQVTLDYDVMYLGKDHLHEFLGYIMQEYVKFYKGMSVRKTISSETIKARRIPTKYPQKDIVYLLVLLRGYYGRYSGKEEYDTMVKSMVKEIDTTDTKDFIHKDTSFNKSMLGLHINLCIEKDVWWQKTRDVGGRLTNIDYGLTERDKRVAEKAYSRGM